MWISDGSQWRIHESVDECDPKVGVIPALNQEQETQAANFEESCETWNHPHPGTVTG